MDVSLILFAGVAFLAVLLALEGIYILWASRHSAANSASSLPLRSDTAQ